ncbi:hypothetical protein SAMD00019534_027530, partial [Acytostelium subglobosum LB1]|uniref:hypothetical protein n=1 Tax=Acytostelium subglobosum LB1 TaxID=1410327 RepID=UPI000644C725
MTSSPSTTTAVSSMTQRPWLLWTLCLLVSLLGRYLVSIHSYSGHATPPMFGDFEAQRHWMEITTNLASSQWYFNTTDNNLQYWGLDYPPLTAYSSWLFGKVAEKIEPGLVQLFTSRGYETPSSKLFMRMTVIISDMFIWLPSVYFFVRSFYSDRSLIQRSCAFLFISLQPGLLLIDHGHFQYNGISLGFALFAITFIVRRQHLLASFFFVLSLNYKQISLYYSPVFFFYLLFANLSFTDLLKSIGKIMSIGVTVISTFIVCWLPFLSLEQITQLLIRLFPTARGLFEDKVANFWCVFSVVVNFKSRFTHEIMLRICTLSTLTVFSPIIYPLWKSSKDIKRHGLVFIQALIICSFAFFLFSFHVHEKTILFPMLPISLLVLHFPFITWWFGVISTFSMFPLLFKDGLILPYFVCQIVYFVLGYQWVQRLEANNNKSSNLWQYSFLILNVITMVLCHILFQFIKPPVHLPALFLLLVAVVSFVHFGLTYLYFVVQMFKCSATNNNNKTKSH